MQDIRAVRSLFTRRYVIAISLIALLSSGAFYILHLALKEGDSTALVVNISGKQRMLSQRIASLSQYYQHLMVKGHEHDDPKELAYELQKSIHEMRLANEALSTGELNPDVTVSLSTEIAQLYFGETDLKKRVDAYLDKTQQLFEVTDDQARDVLVNEIVNTSRALLPDLHAAVVQYQEEGEENISDIRTLETLAWILTLFTLMLEVIFIFQPMANKIGELFSSIHHHEENLEHQIKLRTMSLEQANVKLANLASHDPLTGLKNRLNLESNLELLVTYYHKNHIPFGVVMIDIDWFKKINDNYGHGAGDFILKELAIIIEHSIRAEDAAYRAGGEEFVIIYNRISKEMVMEKAEELRSKVEEHHFYYDDQEVQVTISGGIFHSDVAEVGDIKTILKYADSGLYQSKRSGRNTMILSDSLKVHE